ncbi:hypothetical protein B4U80_09879 [Leptotrombidium deliense]|uniref:RRM domain-containing protein n=1 Tax=Leptotrombidium deliense TaxID=299467 RepID=A0A443SL62_9ACAR|nr:hypothetical protein B4U80_09879 [Leptotrombidium deliense]
MFSVYGNIEECTILKDATGQSKGCAFVTYSSRVSAVNAIKAMNHAITLEGCSSPLVVKFADSQKEKEQRKQQQQLVQQLWSAITTPTLSTTNPYLAFATMAAAQQQHQNQFAAAAATLALQQQLSPFATQDPFALSALTSNPLLATICNTPTNAVNTATAVTSPTLTATNLYSNQSLVNKANTCPAAQLTAIPTLAIATAKTNGTRSSHQIPKQMEGPEGANLFIYHLPAEYMDPDLVDLFSSFGNIVSSRVFIDKQTNLSKCFGFVSFDNPMSAQAAIQAMNGFQVANKRLKVQLKKVKEKPY